MTAANVPLRLLIVEGEATGQFMIERLTGAGYQVATARSASEAMEKLSDGTFHMILIDANQSGIDAFALSRTVRSLDPPHFIYILLLAAEDPEELCADDCLRKPIDPRQLLARVAIGARVVRLELALRQANALIEHLSATDAALNIYNRQYLDTELQREIERARRYERSLSVLVCSMDELDLLTEQHGHAIGEEIMSQFVSLASGQLRPSDWIARSGGEELAIVLPETRSEGAIITAEKIRDSLSRGTVHTSIGEIRVTASFGVSSLVVNEQDDEDEAEPATEIAAQLLSSADAALRQIRRQGRNQTRVA